MIYRKTACAVCRVPLVRGRTNVSAGLCQPQPPMPTISCTRRPRRPSHKNSLLRPSYLRRCRTSYVELAAGITPRWPTVCRCILPSTQDWTFCHSIRLFSSTLV